MDSTVHLQQQQMLGWGETIYRPTDNVEFTFTYDLHDLHHVLKVNIDVPLKKSVKEFAYRLISSHSLPCYMHDNLINSLDSFVKQKTKEFNTTLKNNLFNTTTDTTRKEQLIKQWSNTLEEGSRGSTNDMSFDNSWSDVYHTLIHSPALEALLQLEYSYSVAMKEVVRKKDLAMQELQDKQLVEMEMMISKVGTTKTDTDINNLAANHLDESQMLQIYWSSALSDLQETQKREYRQWVLDVHEEAIADESCDIPTTGIQRNRTPSMESYQLVTRDDSPQESVMEESFTIHLGTQMKTMHNIRLVCKDILDYCKCKISYVGGNMVPHPQRLQTAMTLYSQSLSALFLLVDDRLDTAGGTRKEFMRICNESTDFHFPNYEKQVCMIEQTLQDRPTRKRTLRTSSFHNASQGRHTTSLLQTGDFYITKHSNLAEVHAVFQLVTDESVTSASINSRHPILIGVRNIMLAAARHNITNIIIPLLLVHEMGENLTVQWCMKRAELVLKCVKGFMMESLSWDGHESRTLQFVVPPGINEDMFIAFSNMLPSIFRVSNPLDLSNLTVK